MSFNLALAYPHIQHTAHSIRFGIKMQGNVTQGALPALFEIITDL
jgi:hypothetical protein